MKTQNKQKFKKSVFNDGFGQWRIQDAIKNYMNDDKWMKTITQNIKSIEQQ